MKKKVISIVSAISVGSIVAFMLIFSAPETHASGTAAANIEVLNVNRGKCTGPKGASTKNCEATNLRACSDLSGCSSLESERQGTEAIQ